MTVNVLKSFDGEKITEDEISNILENLDSGELQLLNSARPRPSAVYEFTSYEINVVYIFNLTRSMRSLVRKKIAQPNGQLTKIGYLIKNNLQEIYESFDDL